MMGNYYVYDSISPLADLLKSQLGFTDSNIGLLLAIYSIPNVFMVLLGGIIIDRIGIKKSSFIFSLFIFIGSIVTAFGGGIWVMAGGRLIFGLGAESMIVAITTALARWFKGKELSFAFGLNLTIARLGSFMALNSPSWAKDAYVSWQKPLFITVGAASICVITLALYYFMDTFAEKKYSLPKENKQDKVNLREIFDFGRSFWFITLLCITFYAAMFPFQTFAIKFFQDVHGVSRDQGGFLSSMLTLAAMIFTPLFGLWVDKVGKRSWFMMIGSLMIVPVYLMMGYKFDIAALCGFPEHFHVLIPFLKIDTQVLTNLFLPMSIMGLAFSMIPAVMWPSVALVVDASKLGTAYGLMTMIQNIGLAGFNLLIGMSNDIHMANAAHPTGYIPGMWIFSGCGIIGMVFAFLLKRNELSTTHGHGLDNR
jgi:MFS family permease